jgi:hypothetical protein
VKVEHRMDWGRTPGGKRYASCSCGFRAPARSRLTHGMSDVRDHLSALRRQAAAQGWSWSMIGHGMGLVLDDDPVADQPVVETEHMFDTRRAHSEGRAPRRVASPRSVAPVTFSKPSSTTDGRQQPG